MKTYQDFLTALGQQESSGDYSIENGIGFIGKYQFGEGALIDLKYYIKDGTGKNDWIGSWTGKDGIFSKTDFLNNHIVQDSAILDYMQIQWGYIRKVHQYEGQTLNGVKITLSGMLAGAHLVGHVDEKKYMNSGGDVVPIDGNKVKITTYIQQFAGYDTPFTVDHSIDETINGGSGNDVLNGFGGNDSLTGENGNDTLIGGEGNDNLKGSSSVVMIDNDLLIGGSGDDTLEGGGGNDTLEGGSDYDTYYAYDGNTIDDYSPFIMDRGGRVFFANQLLTGGIQKAKETDWKDNSGHTYILSGDNLIVKSSDGSSILIQHFKNDDLGIHLIDTTTAVSKTTRSFIGDFAALLTDTFDLIYDELGNWIRNFDIISSAHADTFIGGGSSDLMQGFGGSDKLKGQGGEDVLEGGDDSDILVGGTENDTLYADSIASLDSVYDSDTVPAGNTHDWLAGNNGDDQLFGSAGSDGLSGGEGNDLIVGGAGNDYIVGDIDYVAQTFDWTATDQNNTILFSPVDNFTNYANANGKDAIFAGGGNDYVWADGGDDIVFGDAGNDDLNGDDGNDYLDGGADNDTLRGGGQDDTVLGGSGDDKLWGDESTANLSADYHGNDLLEGGIGNDTLVGGGKNDSLYGGDNNDQLFGDNGDVPVALQREDFLDGGNGNDTLLGYGGNDTLLGGEGSDRLSGNEGDDYLDGGNGDDNALNGCALFGGEGNDTILGSGGNDELQGGIGDDSLDGGTENDYLFGQEGDDILLGGAGADELQGNAGNDSLDGGTGTDYLFGQEGDDTLDGGAGDDVLQGGSGNDHYRFGIGSGFDIAYDTDGQYDEVLLENGLSLNDITLARSGNSVIVNIKNTSDYLQLYDYFLSGQQIEALHFSDGTLFSAAAINQAVNYNTAPTAVDDNIVISEDNTGSILGNVLSNDYDLNTGNTLALVGQVFFSSSSYGNLNFNWDGWFVYNPIDYNYLAAGETVTNTFNYVVTDYALYSSATLNITIEGRNDAPVVSQPIAAQNKQSGQNFVFAIPNETFTDVDQNDVLTLSAQLSNGQPLPSWLSFDSLNNTLTGTPQTNEAGLFQIEVTATDGYGASTNSVFALTIASHSNPPPSTQGQAILGSSVDDTLSGGAGNDSIKGGDGNDSLIAGLGNDFLNGSTGFDTVDYSYTTANLNITLDSSGWATVNIAVDDIDTLAAIENLTGGAGNDTFIGNSLANVLKGNGGDDILNGGKGKDVLSGGQGADKFVFEILYNGDLNKDIITDFNAVEGDKIQLPKSVFTAFSSLNAVANINLLMGSAALDNNDFLIYNPATGLLSYDADGVGSVHANIAPLELAMLGVDSHPATLAANDFILV